MKIELNLNDLLMFVLCTQVPVHKADERIFLGVGSLSMLHVILLVVRYSSDSPDCIPALPICPK